jgi:hypothetical protein
MRGSGYTNFILTCITICLVILVAEQWRGTHSVAAAATPNEQWEYHVLIKDIVKWSGSDEPKLVDDDAYWADGIRVPGTHTWPEMLDAMGQQGWELVGCSPRADLWNTRIGFGVDNPNGVGGALNGYLYGDFANGVTTREACYFKRPKR